MEASLLLVLLYKPKKIKFKYRHTTHPLFIQFKKLLGDFGCAERQPQTGYIELGNDLLQDFFEWQTPNCAMSPCRCHCILQNGASQGHQLYVGNEQEL